VIRRTLLIFLLAIPVLLLIVLLVCYALLGTNSGFRWSGPQLEALVPGLELTESDGNLKDGLAAEQLTWKNDSLIVNIQDINSTWRSGCILKFTYCLDQLHLGTVAITSLPNTANENKSNTAISLPPISLPVDIDAREITIESLTLDLGNNSAPVVLKNLRLGTALIGQELTIRQLAGEWEQHRVEVAGDITLNDNYPLATTISLFSKALIDGSDLSTDITLSGSLDNLQVSGQTSGAIEARINGLINPLEPKLPMQLDLAWTENGWPVTTHETIRSTNAKLTLDGTLDDYEIDFKTNLSGQGFPPLAIQVMGRANPQRALLPTIDLLTLDGYATGSAAVDWTQDITWIADLIAKEINPGSYWPEMSGQLSALTSASGVIADGQWSLGIDQLKVNGDLREFPFALNAAVSKSLDDLWQVQTLTLENGPNQLQLSGSYGDTLDLKSSIDFPAIHFLVPNTAGNLNADATISGSLDKPSINLAATSSLIKLGRNLFREMELNTTIVEAGEAQSSLNLNIGRLNADTQQFDNTRIAINGILEDHSVEASVTGPQDTAMNIGASGRLDENKNWQGKLNVAKVSVPSHTAQLQNNATLRWQNDTATFTIDPHCWDVEGAALCLKNALPATTSGKANLELTDYRLDRLNPMLPQTAGLDGELNASAQLVWGHSKDDQSTRSDADKTAADTLPFKLDLAADVNNGRVSVRDTGELIHTFRFDSLQLKTRADPYSVIGDLSLKSEELGNGAIGLTLNPRNPTNDIAGEVSLNDFDIAFLKAFLPQVNDIGGTVNVAGKLAGSLSDPEFDGTVTLLDPILTSEDLPLPIDGGKIAARIAGQRAELEGQLASAQGRLMIDGNVSWLNLQPRARINITGESIMVRQAPVTFAQVNPAIRIDYSPEQLGVSGKVVVPSADINIRELPEGTSALSSDVIIIEEIDEQPTIEESDPLNINVNVNVELGDDVNLSGYGLEAKLSGNVSVAKRGDDPVQLGGEMIVSEGFYRSYGQDLTVNDGRILFVGPVEKTTLNIDAVREIDNEERVAGLHIEGNISDPKVTLFTEPADKTQESILAYIVLGRDLDDGTDTDESQLLAAAALAFTLKEGKGFATGFAESLGISDFSMITGGSGDDTQVIVSGRLSSQLLLRYGRNVFDAEDTLFLRYDLSKRLYLEAARGVERAVDLFYSFSF